MLQITIPDREGFDEINEEFVTISGATLQLEHSLLSLSKWESKHKKPFLGQNRSLTREESLDYIRCMTITKNVDPTVYYLIDDKIMDQISEYLEDSMTATWFSEEENKKSKPNRETITSELIYYWMVAHQIPFECEKWHLNRLLTLIQVCNIKNQPQKKMTKSEIMARNAKLNAERRAKLKSKG